MGNELMIFFLNTNDCYEIMTRIINAIYEFCDYLGLSDTGFNKTLMWF